MNTDGDFNDIATNSGKTIYDYFKNEYGIVREDEVNDFKVKYRNHTGIGGGLAQLFDSVLYGH